MNRHKHGKSHAGSWRRKNTDTGYLCLQPWCPYDSGLSSQFELNDKNFTPGIRMQHLQLEHVHGKIDSIHWVEDTTAQCYESQHKSHSNEIYIHFGCWIIRVCKGRMHRAEKSQHHSYSLEFKFTNPLQNATGSFIMLADFTNKTLYE